MSSSSPVLRAVPRIQAADGCTTRLQETERLLRMLPADAVRQEYVSTCDPCRLWPLSTAVVMLRTGQLSFLQHKMLNVEHADAGDSPTPKGEKYKLHT